MMSQFDFTHDKELITGMFHKCDADLSNDIDWKEYPCLDSLLAEDFDPSFYARQRKAREAREARNQVTPPDTLATKAEAPTAARKEERNANLAAAIVAQAKAVADVPD